MQKSGVFPEGRVQEDQLCGFSFSEVAMILVKATPGAARRALLVGRAADGWTVVLLPILIPGMKRRFEALVCTYTLTE